MSALFQDRSGPDAWHRGRTPDGAREFEQAGTGCSGGRCTARGHGFFAAAKWPGNDTFIERGGGYICFTRYHKAGPAPKCDCEHEPGKSARPAGLLKLKPANPGFATPS